MRPACTVESERVHGMAGGMAGKAGKAGKAGGTAGMRVLGVDPGLSACGLAVVDAARPTAALVRAGVVRTRPETPTPNRLAELYAEVTEVLSTFSPQVVAVERVFVNANRTTGMGVGQAAGVVLLAAAQAGLSVVEYTPSQVKAAVTGQGDADKAQVGFMVRALLGLPAPPQPADVADALALALCHLRLGAPAASAAGAGSGAPAMSQRLAAALAEAGPGAQVTRPAPPSVADGDRP